MSETWVVVPTCLPIVLRRCHRCASGRFRANGKFRVNANHKLLDVWLLALCTACGDTTRITVLERVNVRSVQAELLNLLHENDPGLAAELLQDPVVRRRNHIALDWDNAWHLDGGAPDRSDQPDRPDRSDRPVRSLPPEGEAIEVAVRFEARIPVRPVRLIAEGFGLSRAEVERLLAGGNLVSTVRLSGRLSGDFTFTLKR
ncbi:DUF1062 domain-containing protein [Streptomyces sp. H27-G5]|uniref:DUF1062 domain-containing protein n=1 Tax=Streptomyces sp. H27-G5 TaxID=2996698 RepID=UPI00226DD3DB|nr:DUF1062 domain-containing protein [Streptomyces sp. H27-G5]MCY0918947.1 DUF1062 domain-containing protein [Streptomyces sp. H27-G5]